MYNSQISAINLVRICKTIVLFFGLIVLTNTAKAYELSNIMVEKDEPVRQYRLPKTEETNNKTKKFLTLVKTDQKIRFTKNDLFCLAKNIYHEARGEPTVGKYAVAQVTINRLADTRFYGNTVCKIVTAPRQFSWTLNESLHKSQPSGKDWDESTRIAKSVLEEGVRLNGMDSALYFHAHYVNPKWRKFVRLTQIGGHIFYGTKVRYYWVGF
jgi:spore germination cell wall hydrolase CwlJ-like protein